MPVYQKVPPLDWQTPIVDPKTGVPSPQFMRLWQQLFGNTDGTAETVEEVAEGLAIAEGDIVDLQNDKADKTITITGASPLGGGGNLSANRTITHNTSGVTPGSYTNLNATIDAYGHVTMASSGSGGGGGLTLIGSNTFAGSTSTYTFSAIPGTYSSLILIAVLRSSIAATGGNASIRFNGDTGANYIRHMQSLVNATYSGAAAVSQTAMGQFGIPGSTAPAGAFGRANFEMPGYALTVNQKRCGGLNAYRVGNAAANVGMDHIENEWLNTAAVTSVTIFENAGNNFVNGSTVWLYGVP